MYKNDNSHSFCFPVIPLLYQPFLFSVCYSETVQNILMILGRIIEWGEADVIYKNDNSHTFCFPVILLYRLFSFSVYLTPVCHLPTNIHPSNNQSFPLENLANKANID